MKIKKLAKYKTKLLKLKLLKTKIYENQKNFNYVLLKDSETRLKKILHVIYRFHVANKKILFIGMPLWLNAQMKQFFFDKKHSFLPENIWIDGIVTNSKASFKHLLKRHAIHGDKTSKFLFKLKNQIDLVVTLNEEKNLKALKESALQQVPTVSLNSNYNSMVTNLITYKVPGNYSFAKKEVRRNFFFLLLSSLFKKAEILKKKQLQTTKRRNKLKTRKKKQNYFNYKKNVSSK